MTDSRKDFITKKKQEAQDLKDSLKVKGGNILGTTWREQNLWTKILEKRIENLGKQLKLLELPIKASRTTPAATEKPPIKPFDLGFNKQTITSGKTGTWQWTSLSRIREESRPDPRANGIISEDVWETIKKTIIVKEGFVRLKTSDNVSNVLDIVRQMKDLIRDARKEDYTLKKEDDEYDKLMETATKKIIEEMDRQLTPRERVGNSVFSYRVSSLLLVPGVSRDTINNDMVLDVYPAILLRPDKLKKKILDIKKGFKIEIDSPATPATPKAIPKTKKPAVSTDEKAQQEAVRQEAVRLKQEARDALEQEAQQDALELKAQQDAQQIEKIKDAQQIERQAEERENESNLRNEIAREQKANQQKLKIAEDKKKKEKEKKEKKDQAALDLKAQQPKEEVKEEEAQQPKEEEAQEVQEEKEEEKDEEAQQPKEEEAQEEEKEGEKEKKTREKTPPAPSTKPDKPLPAPPAPSTKIATVGETKTSQPSTSPEPIAYNTGMKQEIYTVMRTSLEDKDFWSQITDVNDKKDGVWDEKKKLINQLYPLPELELWKGKTVESLKANLTTLLDATEKLTYVEANQKINANKKTKTPEIPATYTFSYVGYDEKKQEQVLRNLVLPQTNLPEKLKKRKSYLLTLKHTDDTDAKDAKKVPKTTPAETKYYYPTDNLDFEETNFTTRTVKPIATPIPSGELSAMLAELSSMENTSDSEYAEEKWASDSEDFASDSEEFASDEF